MNPRLLAVTPPHQRDREKRKDEEERRRWNEIKGFRKKEKLKRERGQKPRDCEGKRAKSVAEEAEGWEVCTSERGSD